LQGSGAFVDEVAASDDSEIWVPPRIERLYEDEYIIGVSKPGTLLVSTATLALWFDFFLFLLNILSLFLREFLKVLNNGTGISKLKV